MHELGVVFKVIEIVEEVAEQNSATSVSSVTLQIGEVSGIINSYLYDCWKWAIKKSKYLQEAELRIEEIKAVTFCEDCKKEYGTVEHGRTCPHCGSEHTYLLYGREFEVKEIEI